MMINQITDRRTVLMGTAAAIGSILPISTKWLAANKIEDAFDGFQVGVQSFCWHRFPLKRTLEDIENLGLNRIELFPGHAPVESSSDEINRILKMCGDHNVKPVAVGVLSFSNDHSANQRVFEYAAQMGVRSIGADPSWDSFDSLDKLVDEYQIPIAIHPHGPVGKQLHPWHRAEIILDHVKHHHALIGTCLDTGHLIRCAQPPFNILLDPARQIRTMGSRNYGIHLKDHDNRMNKNVIFGKGALNVPDVLTALNEVKFDRHISIEHEAHPEDPVPEIRECIAAFREAVKAI